MSAGGPSRGPSDGGVPLGEGGGMRGAIGEERQVLLAGALAQTAPELGPLAEVHPTVLTAEQLAALRAALAHAVLGAALAVDDELDERGEALHDLVEELAPWHWGHA